MAEIWNGDLTKPWPEQYGGCEYVGTMQGNQPPVSTRVIQSAGIDGYSPRTPNTSMLKFIVKPGDRYGSSSGERTLLRQYDEPFPARREGWKAAMALSILFPNTWPGGSNFDAWQLIEWHGSGGPPACIGLRPGTSNVALEVKGGPVTSWVGSKDDNVADISGNKGIWHDFIVDYYLHPSSGYVRVHHRLPSKAETFTKTADINNRPTIYTGQSLYVLMGLYGPAMPYDRVVYHGGAREFSAFDEALAWMNSLDNGEPVPPEPLPPDSECQEALEQAQADLAEMTEQRNAAITELTSVKQRLTQVHSILGAGSEVAAYEASAPE